LPRRREPLFLSLFSSLLFSSLGRSRVVGGGAALVGTGWAVGRSSSGGGGGGGAGGRCDAPGRCVAGLWILPVGLLGLVIR